MQQLLSNYDRIIGFGYNLLSFLVDLSSWEAKIEEDQDVSYHDNCSEEELEGEIHVHDVDCSYQEETEFKKGVLTIGCIGNFH